MGTDVNNSAQDMLAMSAGEEIESAQDMVSIYLFIYLSICIVKHGSA